MPSHINMMGTMVKLDPEQAKSQILHRAKEFDGNAVACAEAYGVSPRTFNRWMATLGINDDLAVMREEARAAAEGEAPPENEITI